MSYLLVFSLLLLSMSFFATSQFGHYRSVSGKKLLESVRYRQLASAWCWLTIALIVACLVKGFAEGALIWVGLLTPTALAVLVLLQWRASWLTSVRIVGLAVALLTAVTFL